MSIGQQLSPDAQYQLALKMPIERLMAIIRGQPAQIDPSTALAALKMHNQIKIAAQGQEALQQSQQPSVKDREMQMAGLTQIPANNMNGLATAAQGGIVGYADGGGVQHFQVGGVPNLSTMSTEEFNKWLETTFGPSSKPTPAAPAEPATPATRYDVTPKGGVSAPTRAPFTPRVAPTAGPGLSFAQVFPGAPSTAAAARAALPYAARFAAFAGPAAVAAGLSGAASYGLGRGIMNLTGGDQVMTDLIARITGLSAKEAEMLDPQTKKMIVQQAAPAPAPAPALAARTTARNAAPAAAPPRSLAEIAASESLNDAPALTLAQVQARMTGNPAAPAAPAAPATGIDALKRPNFTAIANLTNASNPFSTKLADALKELTSSTEEKDKQKSERLGVMALEAASALLQPGTTGAGARSAVFGKMAALTQQYSKEDSEAKRALIGAKISVLGTQATLAQGDMKSAIDMFNHGETTTMHYAKIESDKAYHDALLKLEGSKLSQLEQIAKAKQAGENRHNDVMAAYYKAQEPLLAARAIYYKAGAAAQGNKGRMTGAQYGAISAKAATAVDKRLAIPGELYTIKKDPAFKDFTNTQIRDALIAIEMQRSMPGVDLGITARTPPESIQRNTLPGKLSSLSDDED